jgi:hypothetical protein
MRTLERILVRFGWVILVTACAAIFSVSMLQIVNHLLLESVQFIWIARACLKYLGIDW